MRTIVDVADTRALASGFLTCNLSEYQLSKMKDLDRRHFDHKPYCIDIPIGNAKKSKRKVKDKKGGQK